jgi:hypothetical protein
MNVYEVVFGNPSKEMTTTIEVAADSEQGAIARARVDAFEPWRKARATILNLSK